MLYASLEDCLVIRDSLFTPTAVVAVAIRYMQGLKLTSCSCW